jgi:subtilisin family serine protease
VVDPLRPADPSTVPSTPASTAPAAPASTSTSTSTSRTTSPSAPATRGLDLASVAVPDPGRGAVRAPVPTGSGSTLLGLRLGRADIQPLPLLPSDRPLTDADWTAAKPKLDALPKRATPEARQILAAWADPTSTLSAATKEQMRAFLAASGYPMPQPGAPVPPGGIEAIRAGNLSEDDAELTRLSALTGKTDTTTTLAVIDAAFDITHPALQNRLWTNPNPDKGDLHGFNFRLDSPKLREDGPGTWDPMGINGFESRHGTKTLGIATQGSDRLKAIACAAADSPVAAPYTRAIDYAVAHGARVISMSFSVEDDDVDKKVAAVQAAVQRYPDVLFVEASGNDGVAFGTGPLVPATELSAHVMPNYVVVGSSGDDGERLKDSTFGDPYTTVAARANFYTPVSDGGFVAEPGATSEATPAVSNVAAKCLLLDPALKPADLKQLLIDSADARDSWKGNCVSNGPVNPGRAMRLAALTGLVRSGMTADAAADRIQLAGDERAALVPLVARYTAGVGA